MITLEILVVIGIPLLICLVLLSATYTTVSFLFLRLVRSERADSWQGYLDSCPWTAWAISMQAMITFSVLVMLIVLACL